MPSCANDHEELGVSERSFTLRQATPCEECAYDLQGLNSVGNCPECGIPIRRSLPGAPLFAERPEQDGPLEEQACCVRCGEELLKTSVHSGCVNCGAPVWYSIYGTWVRTSSVIWLERIRFRDRLVTFFASVVSRAIRGGICGPCRVGLARNRFSRYIRGYCDNGEGQAHLHACQSAPGVSWSSRRVSYNNPIPDTAIAAAGCKPSKAPSFRCCGTSSGFNGYCPAPSDYSLPGWGGGLSRTCPFG